MGLSGSSFPFNASMVYLLFPFILRVLQVLSKYCPQTSSIGITPELVRNAESHALPSTCLVRFSKIPLSTLNLRSTVTDILPWSMI